MAEFSLIIIMILKAEIHNDLNLCVASYCKHDMLPSMPSHAMQCNTRIGIFALAALRLTNQFSEFYTMQQA